MKNKIKSIIPTTEEYLKAKEIVTTYETEKEYLYNLKIESFRIELQNYFDNNLIDGFFYLKKFSLQKNFLGNGVIIPLEPSMEENYNGGNDIDITEICKKYDVDFKIVYWCYHK